MKVFQATLKTIFLVELFAMINFRLWSISLIMACKAEIARTLQIDTLQQKCMLSQLKGD
jgi:hypothetical protein